MDIVQALKFLGYMLVMLAVVPLAGLCVTGSWKQAWRYSRAWAQVIVWTVIVAAVVFLIVWQLIPTPD